MDGGQLHRRCDFGPDLSTPGQVTDQPLEQGRGAVVVSFGGEHCSQGTRTDLVDCHADPAVAARSLRQVLRDPAGLTDPAGSQEQADPSGDNRGAQPREA
jgi:hypothetical protein